eukprot:Hpha_TRINITY_DN12930_c0_g3::TRINITY_DN12930_c0_g3_i1::g.164287::m.164287
MDPDLERLLGSEEDDKKMFYSELQGRTPWRDPRTADDEEDEEDLETAGPPRQVHLHAADFMSSGVSGATIGEVIRSPPLRHRPPPGEAIPVRRSVEVPDSVSVTPIRCSGRRSAGRGSLESSGGWRQVLASSASLAGPLQLRRTTTPGPVGGSGEAPGSLSDLVKSPSTPGTGLSSTGASFRDRLAQMKAEREASRLQAEKRKQDDEGRRLAEASRKAEQATAAASRADDARAQREALEESRATSGDPIHTPLDGGVPPRGVQPLARPPSTPAEETLQTVSPDSSAQRTRSSAQHRSGDAVAVPAAAVPRECTKCPVAEEGRVKAEGRYRDKAAELRRLHEEHSAVLLERDQLRKQVGMMGVELSDAHARRAEAEERSAQGTAEIHRLSALLDGRSIRTAVGSGQMEYLTKDQTDKLRSEIAAQDAELRGLNEDNRQKTDELRDLRQQLRTLREDLAEKDRQRARAAAASPGGADATSQVARELTRENNRLKDHLRVVQQEHELEVTALRTAKQELERKLERVDWQKAQDDEIKIRDLQSQVQKAQQDKVHKVSELEGRLKWYIENQELLSKHDELVHQQTSEIETLKGRVLELDTGLNKPKGLNQAKYIGELQRKIKTLEDVVRTKNPNSIAELIRACKPTDTEVAAYRQLQERVHQLHQELEERQGEYDKGLRQLRHESDRLRVDYERRLRGMEEEMKVKVRCATSDKVKELSRSLEETRTHYVRKLKERDHQLLSLRRVAKQKGVALPDIKDLPAPAQAPSAASAQKGRGAGEAAAATSTVESGVQTDLTVRPSEGASMGAWQAHGFGAGGLAGAQMPQMQGMAAMQGMGGMQGMMFGMPPYLSMLQQADIAQLSRQAEGLRGELDAAKRAEREKAGEASRAAEQLTASLAERDRMAGEAARFEGALRSLQEQFEMKGQMHASELQKLREQHQVALTEQRKQWDSDVQRLQQICDRDRAHVDLAALRKGDQLQYLNAVKERLDAVERRHAARESEMARALEEAKRMAEFELDVQRQKMDLVIQSKNNDIDRFRLQLDALLGELELLRDQRLIGEGKLITAGSA